MQKRNRVCKVLWCMFFQAMGRYNLLLQLNNLRRAVKGKKQLHDKNNFVSNQNSYSEIQPK